jgi:surface polysaccharide O-acyltransferase-like enzyme
MRNTAPKWVAIIGIVLILWNLMGTAMFGMDMMRSPADIKALPQDQQALWAQMPVWAWAGYGLGTIGGLLAAIGILRKKKWASMFALLSVIGVILNFTPTFFLSSGVDVWQPKFYAFPLVILALALVQLWVARKGNADGWNS